MKFGVQLYGPLNNMQGEVLEKLAALAKAGITEIEPCMTTGPILGPEGVIWPADWLLAHIEEIRDMACGLYQSMFLRRIWYSLWIS